MIAAYPAFCWVRPETLQCARGAQAHLWTTRERQNLFMLRSKARARTAGCCRGCWEWSAQGHWRITNSCPKGMWVSAILVGLMWGPPVPVEGNMSELCPWLWKARRKEVKCPRCLLSGLNFLCLTHGLPVRCPCSLQEVSFLGRAWWGTGEPCDL